MGNRKQNIIFNLVIGWSFLLFVVIVGLTGCYSPKSSGKDTYKPTENLESCRICGGKIVCAVCGNTNALYCEKASYGAGNDHFCGKHWPDVVEWHGK